MRVDTGVAPLRGTRPATPSRLAPVAAAPIRPLADINLFVRAAFYLFVFSIPFEIPNRGIPVEILWLTFAIAIAAG